MSGLYGVMVRHGGRRGWDWDIGLGRASGQGADLQTRLGYWVGGRQ